MHKSCRFWVFFLILIVLNSLNSFCVIEKKSERLNKACKKTHCTQALKRKERRPVTAQNKSLQEDKSNAYLDVPLLDYTAIYETKPQFQSVADISFSLNSASDEIDHWNFHYDWTHLDSTSEEKTLEASRDMVFPEQLTNITLSEGGIAASLSQTFSLNSIDIALGHDFIFNEKMMFRPRIGIGVVKIDQTIHAQYDAMFEVQSKDITRKIPVQTTHTALNNFKGIGLHLGVDAFVYITEEWNVFGKLSGSLIEGRCFMEHALPSFSKEIPIPISASPWRLKTNFEGGIGLGWKRTFFREKCRFTFNLCYEMKQWFTQSQILDLVTAFENRGNNGMQTKKTINDFVARNFIVQLGLDF